MMSVFFVLCLYLTGVFFRNSAMMTFIKNITAKQRPFVVLLYYDKLHRETFFFFFGIISICVILMLNRSVNRNLTRGVPPLSAKNDLRVGNMSYRSLVIITKIRYSKIHEVFWGTFIYLRNCENCRDIITSE